MRCAWCEERIRVGIVTAGGIVYHRACWRRRTEFVWRMEGQCDGPLPTGGHACDPRLHAEPATPPTQVRREPRVKAVWMVSCSCGWNTSTSEEWSARSAAEIHARIGSPKSEHAVSVEQQQETNRAGPAPLD
jgi:hypothetical protein